MALLSSAKPSQSNRLQMNLDSNAKISNVQLSTRFSDDDIDEYEDDFVIDDSSGDDSYEEFLKSKASSKPSGSKIASSNVNTVPKQTKKNVENRFLKGLENDDLGLSFERKKSPTASQNYLYGSQKNPSSNPLLSLLDEKSPSPPSSVDRKSALSTSPRDYLKPKKVGFQPQPTVLEPQNRELSFQGTKNEYLDKEKDTGFVSPSLKLKSEFFDSSSDKKTITKKSKFDNRTKGNDFEQLYQYKTTNTPNSNDSTPRNEQLTFQDGKKSDFYHSQNIPFSQSLQYKKAIDRLAPSDTSPREKQLQEPKYDDFDLYKRYVDSQQLQHKPDQVNVMPQGKKQLRNVKEDDRNQHQKPVPFQSSQFKSNLPNTSARNKKRLQEADFEEVQQAAAIERPGSKGVTPRQTQLKYQGGETNKFGPKHADNFHPPQKGYDPRYADNLHRGQEEHDRRYADELHRPQKEYDPRYADDLHRGQEELDRRYADELHRPQKEYDPRYADDLHRGQEELDRRYADDLHRPQKEYDPRYADDLPRPQKEYDPRYANDLHRPQKRYDRQYVNDLHRAQKAEDTRHLDKLHRGQEGYDRPYVDNLHGPHKEYDIPYADDLHRPRKGYDPNDCTLKTKKLTQKERNIYDQYSSKYAHQSSYRSKAKSSEFAEGYDQFQRTHYASQESNKFSSKYMDYLVEKGDFASTKTADLLLQKDHPVPKPRSNIESRKSSVSERSTKSKSPISTDQPQFRSIENTETTKQTSYTDFVSSLPSLDKSKSKAELKEEKRQREKSGQQTPEVKKEPQKIIKESRQKEDTDDYGGVDGNDLMALFNQVAVANKPPAPNATYPVEIRPQTRTMKPSEAVAQRTMRQATSSSRRQRSSQQLVDDVIETVAGHNFNHFYARQYATAEDDVDVKPKQSAKKKSPKKKLPANYKGLGSLTAFQQLRKFSTNTEPVELSNTVDIRSNAYMQWLANHEKKMKEKKKEKQKEDEKENEEKETAENKKDDDRKSARNAWLMEKDMLRDKEEDKRKEERKKWREKRRREEDKRWKSAKKAEVARERLLIEARKRHQIDIKTKKEEELIKGQKEKDKRKENKQAVAKWKEERGKQWEEERKRELREKHLKEKEKKEYNERKNEDAKQNFREWQAKKDREQYYQSGKISYHGEERPPWCPPNKSIYRLNSAF